MSKGHGVVQRRLLDTLKDAPRPLDVFELAATVFDIDPQLRWYNGGVSERHVVSVRRALRNLRYEGLVEVENKHNRSERCCRVHQYWRLPGRRSLNDDWQEALQALRGAYQTGQSITLSPATSIRSGKARMRNSSQ